MNRGRSSRPTKIPVKKLATNQTDKFESLFTVRVPYGRDYEVNRIFKNAIAEGQRKLVLLPIDRVLCSVETVLRHEMRLYGNSVAWASGHAMRVQPS